MQLTEGVYDLPLDYEVEGTTRTIHPSAVETDFGLVLLDVGFDGETDRLDGALAALDHSLDDVELVVLTHQDGDHTGGLRDVRARTGATVLAHRADAPAIDGRAEPIKSRGERYPPAPVDVEIVDGVGFQTVAGEMRVVATPGHTPGHVSLYLPDAGLLVAADALTARDGRLNGPAERFTPDADAATESVGRLAALDVDRTLCYHGGLVEAGTERIREIYESRQG